MNRRPIVAGQFYPGSRTAWERQVREYLAKAGPRARKRTILAMVPHAGYMFSGSVAGKTFGKAVLAKTVVLLGPNHTGRGQALAVWGSGQWEIPGASLEVDQSLAAAIMAEYPKFKEDTLAHQYEHSLEVLLPFLWCLDPGTKIVPICVADQLLVGLEKAGKALGRVLKDWPEEVSLVVSSDMSHYVPQTQARERDSYALEQAMLLNPVELYNIVRRRSISMCGVLPMTLGLYAALELGAERGSMAGYSTSGDVSGDLDQVVGYAGILVS